MYNCLLADESLGRGGWDSRRLPLYSNPRGPASGGIKAACLMSLVTREQVKGGGRSRAPVLLSAKGPKVALVKTICAFLSSVKL